MHLGNLTPFRTAILSKLETVNPVKYFYQKLAAYVGMLKIFFKNQVNKTRKLLLPLPFNITWKVSTSQPQPVQ